MEIEGLEESLENQLGAELETRGSVDSNCMLALEKGLLEDIEDLKIKYNSSLLDLEVRRKKIIKKL